MGIKYFVSVAVANRPIAALTLAAELAAASPEAVPAPAEELAAAVLLLLLLRLPTTPPTTPPTIARISTGRPNLSQLLGPFFTGLGVM